VLLEARLGVLVLLLSLSHPSKSRWQTVGGCLATRWETQGPPHPLLGYDDRQVVVAMTLLYHSQEAETRFEIALLGF
jgi:hypothetical protein